MRSSHTPLHPQLLSFIYYLLTDRIPSTSCSTRSTSGRSFELASLENGPSLHSNMQLPGSIASSLCHTPLGIFTPYRPSSAHSITSSIIVPSPLTVNHEPSVRLILRGMLMNRLSSESRMMLASIWPSRDRGRPKVNRHLSPRLYGILETMALFIKALMKVVVHPQARGILRLRTHFFQ